jgi:ubiquinone/menaquinone biosynthesis C-methylase UbiE/uncharacterized protein YbaR (Trm112 family)
MEIPPALQRCLPLLRCPLSGKPLSVLTSAELITVNAAVTSGRWRHRDQTAVQEPLTQALGTPDRQTVYRIEEEMVWLLGDMALGPIEQAGDSALRSEKRIVRDFYDEFGWVKNAEGKYNDTAVFTEDRPEVEAYRRTCNARIGRWLGEGEALLDVASGSIPHPEYLDYSARYATRICVDFSVRALREARTKLGNRGLYIIGDITRLPLAAGSIDGVISLHTIYHVPVNEQTKAVDELVRVAKPGGRVIIAYVWARSAAMEAVFRARGILGWLRRGGRASPVAAKAKPDKTGAMPELYFHPQNHDWYAREVASRHQARLTVWSAVSTAFQNRFFTPNFIGRLTIRGVVFLEWMLPGLAARFGQYPLFVIVRGED